MFFGRLVTITAATERFLKALRGDLSVEDLWISSTSQAGSSLWFDSGEKNWREQFGCSFKDCSFNGMLFLQQTVAHEE